MQPCPGRAIATEAQDTLQTQRIGPIFLIGQMPNCTKPKCQRLLTVLKYRANENRVFKLTANATTQTSVHYPRFLTSTVCAPEPLRPAEFKQIFNTRFFSTKLLFHFYQCFWIFLHGGISYIFPLGQSSAYAYSLILSQFLSRFDDSPEIFQAYAVGH